MSRYQVGCLYKESRKRGPAVWVFRYRDAGTNRKEIVGDTEQFPTKTAAMKAVELLRIKINKVVTRTPKTFGELVAHYRAKEMSEGSNKSYSTVQAYEMYIKNRLLPQWENYKLSDIKTVAVEDWLRSIQQSNGTKAKIRNLMSVIFNHAMRHEWSDRNPIHLVRQSAKRESIPDVLTAEEITNLLAQLDGMYYVMTFLAAVTGLRVSELLALKWSDVDFISGEIHLTRAIVCNHVGSLKTETSGKPLAMAEPLSALLLDWRSKCPYKQDEDFVFASIDKRGKQPVWPSSAMSKHIRPAAMRAGIKKHIRWHVFRHTFATLLKANGEDVKTVQESLRHADSGITIERYTQGLMPVKRAAQDKLITQIVPTGSQIVPTSAVSA